MNKTLLLILLNLVLATSCTQPTEETVSAPSTDYCSTEGISTASESDPCTTSTTYTSPAVVSGTAVFYKRDLDVFASGPNITGMRLGAPISSPLPIKYAEVRVLDSNGNIVQCGKTNANGILKAVNGTSNLNIPSTVDTYTIQVLTRSNHAVSVPGGKPAFQLYTSVKSVCTNDVHKATNTVVVTGAGTVSTTITAYARESESTVINGGAFNIYNNIAVTYDYLAQNTGTRDLSCLNNKLQVYWTAGFNPAQFIYPDEDPATLGNLSFFLKGYDELYINGGKLGNVTAADTDHFDDAVIIHEIGHRIEDTCGEMDSPGGAHYGQFRIDPRLAWSEGWGNFLGAHIIRNNIGSINPDVSSTLTAYDGWLYYLDTAGYTEASVTSGDELIRIDLSRPGNDPDDIPNFNYDLVSSTAYPGEGHFREVSVARSLFKTTNSCTTGYCTGSNYFAEMWQAFENAGDGMGQSIYPFRSSIRFYNRLREVFSPTFPSSISTMLETDEAQQLDGDADFTKTVSSTTYTTWVPYGIKLVSNGSTPCPLKIQPRNEDEAVTYFSSDQRYSNHFYYFDRNTLNSVTSITLTATKVSGTNTDIDLLLYQDGYSFPDETCLDNGCTSYTKNTTSPEFIRKDRTNSLSTSTSFTKTISTLNGLSSSLAYLLNIKAYTAGQTILSTTEYNYTLTDQSGDYLCPSTTF